MRGKEKLKMCPFCEGSIASDALECKYCGSQVTRQAKTGSAYAAQDSLASLYEPPYSPTRKTGSRLGVSVDQFAEEEDNIHIASNNTAATTSRYAEETDSEDDDAESSNLGALLLLSIGSQLFTLAWLLFFFSDHGRLTLEWKSRYWFLYALVSLPLLYQGWKKLRQV